ncbi:hypothetical protein OUZ56_011729 [Daphnia magna]|uniref:Uncharacterized protein n=1 Tax=Daphnia magna TaxID=35525 RepID=A0ABQ9Z0Z2_9CRUS|nr:hypothetical protein OUZ56_011729 [Daphnia magna]
MQAVTLSAPPFPVYVSYLALSTPELIPQIQASQKVAEYILYLPSVSVSLPSRSRIFRPPVEPTPQPPAADSTPRRLRMDYFGSAAGRDIDTFIQPPQPPEALRVALVESAQSRLKTGPRLADFIYPSSPKKPLRDQSSSFRIPLPSGVPESEPDDFIPNIPDCEVRSEVGETEETPAPAELEQPVRRWRTTMIYD